MIKISRFTFVELILVLSLIGILSFNCSMKAAYVTLSTSQDFYMKGMQDVADLQSQGIISAEQRVKINDVARIFKNAHNVAVDALATWYKTGQPSDKAKFEIVFAEAAAKWGDLALLINSFKPGTVPGTLTK